MLERLSPVRGPRTDALSAQPHTVKRVLEHITSESSRGVAIIRAQSMRPEGYGRARDAVRQHLLDLRDSGKIHFLELGAERPFADFGDKASLLFGKPAPSWLPKPSPKGVGAEGALAAELIAKLAEEGSLTSKRPLIVFHAHDPAPGSVASRSYENIEAFENGVLRGDMRTRVRMLSMTNRPLADGRRQTEFDYHVDPEELG
jgi:hypothetical protein